MRHILATLSIIAVGLVFTPNAEARDYISIVGSSTVYPFASSVVEHFSRETNYSSPVIESTGSGGGLKLFCAGIGVQHPDITNASRRIKQSEIDNCASSNIKPMEFKIGYDGIVLGKSREGTEFNLTKAQLFLALAETVPQNGELVDNPNTKWSEIDSNLPNTTIKVLGPPPTSGTRDAFVEIVMEKGCEHFDTIKALPESDKERVCQQMRGDEHFVEAGENDTLIIQKLKDDSNALGIFGYSFLDQNRGSIMGLPINGTKPTFEAISSGEYTVSRSLWFYVKPSHLRVIPGMHDYLIEWSKESTIGPNGYLARKGLIPLPKNQREDFRIKVENLK